MLRVAILDPLVELDSLPAFPYRRIDSRSPGGPGTGGAVDHILAIGVEAVPLGVTDEEVLVAHAKEAAGYTLAVLETCVDGVQQFSLAISLAGDVFGGPGVPVGDSLPLGGTGDEVRHPTFSILTIEVRRYPEAICEPGRSSDLSARATKQPHLPHVQVSPLPSAR